MFDSTISLGDVLTVSIVLLSFLAGWMRLEKKVAVLEERVNNLRVFLLHIARSVGGVPKGEE